MIHERSDNGTLCIADILLGDVSDAGRGRIVLDFGHFPVSMAQFLLNTIGARQQADLCPVKTMREQVINGRLERFFALKNADRFARRQRA